jgi:hypothetical protein
VLRAFEAEVVLMDPVLTMDGVVRKAQEVAARTPGAHVLQQTQRMLVRVALTAVSPNTD